MSQRALDAYAGTRAQSARDAQIEEYLPLVQHVLCRLPIRFPTTLDRDDLFSVGVLGLMQAANTYDATKGATFKTHAYVNIRGAMLDELRKHDVVPRSRRDRIREVAEAESRAETRLKRSPTFEEIAAEASLTVTQVEDALVNAHGMAVLSLEDTLANGEGETMRLIDTVRLPSAIDPSSAVADKELKDRLATAIAELPARERHVIVLYYAEGLRLKEIGEVLSVTESRVCQLHVRALKRLDRALNSKRIGPKP